MGMTEVQAYLQKVGIELDEPMHMAVCEIVSCKTLGEFERESFIKGWLAISDTGNKALDTISKQSAYLTATRKQLSKDRDYFKKVYRATFPVLKPENQRALPIDTATDAWTMMFDASKGGMSWVTPTASSVDWLGLWIAYIKDNHKRPVTKDLWNMAGELFLKTTEGNAEKLHWWTEEGAWPMAIDEFLMSVRDSHAEVGPQKKEAEGASDEMDTS
jgi:DCN1-like protein 1/2